MVKIIPKNHPDAVKEACNVLYDDGIIVYPTDTIYGFGCNAKSEAAINKLNSLLKKKGAYERIVPQY